MKLFISGYGGGDTDSIGLYDIGNDGKGKTLLWGSSKDRDSNVDASTFLSIHKDQLFGITEKGGGSPVYMFNVLDDDYRLLDSREIDGEGLCHISYLPKNKVLLGGCYGSGHVFSIEAKEDKFGEILSHLRQGDDSEKITRAHCVVADKEEKRLYSANIALDRIYFYNIEKGSLVEDGFLQLDKGEGPRHIELHPKLDLMYIITEYSNRIIVVDIGGQEAKIVQKISTLPEGFEGESFCSTLCLTKDEKFLYGANRGSNTIGIFKLDDGGILEKISDHDCFGDWPRHIDLIGDDGYIAIANQNSNEVVVAKRDKTSGLITGAINRIEFSKPSFVQDKI